MEKKFYRIKVQDLYHNSFPYEDYLWGYNEFDVYAELISRYQKHCKQIEARDIKLLEIEEIKD